MSAKRVFTRETARRDMFMARDSYRREAGVAVAGRFLDAVQAALRTVREFPGRGSARYAQILEQAELRFVNVPGYPYLVFYLERDGAIEIWRVLHAQRDIPDRLPESD